MKKRRKSVGSKKKVAPARAKAARPKAKKKAVAPRGRAASGPARIGAAEAAPYVEGRLQGDWYERFERHAGTTKIGGPMSLDREDIDAIIIDGDLEVDGPIVNRDGEVGVALVVTGDVRARDLIAGGAEIVVGGDLIVSGTVFGFYNHGSVTVHGATCARAIITEYHHFDLRGPVEAITVGGRGQVTSADRYRAYAPALVPEVLTEGTPPGGYPDWARTAEAILAGRPVLRPGIT